jgi:hypothetical protein
MEPHACLKHARIALGEEIAAVSERIGVAERLLRTIEDGRFEDLPSGIYGRAAIRSYAAALGLDPTEILTACEAQLPVLDDPIRELGRLRGVRQPKVQPSRPEVELAAGLGASCPDWRLAAAAAVDAGLIGALLVAVVGSASLVAGAPPPALAGSALAFALVSLLLGSSYFVWLGGVSGATGGERWMGRPPAPQPLRCLNLRGIAIRAVRSATDDLRFIRGLGVWIGRLATDVRATRTALATIVSRARSSVG